MALFLMGLIESLPNLEPEAIVNAIAVGDDFGVVRTSLQPD
jgi:hypothetical protein